MSVEVPNTSPESFTFCFPLIEIENCVNLTLWHTPSQKACSQTPPFSACRSPPQSRHHHTPLRGESLDTTDSRIVVALKFPLHLVHKTGTSNTLY